MNGDVVSMYVWRDVGGGTEHAFNRWRNHDAPIWVAMCQKTVSAHAIRLNAERDQVAAVRCFACISLVEADSL
ncbi:hypothetical protein SAMN05216188_11834 [Lentzea xinjiangensis]|uniref:Uncharacterized protein n=1 Tax=Lentzea xinjiangensis TaxID=402600 RepID=A0A1H9TDI4_9PSEU|nr:hypothetical protein [Lentzea xinjiangensis]SER94879.1 hypothetical protein SAMN05216188_11834 [Lentzea xinjiangensis]